MKKHEKFKIVNTVRDIRLRPVQFAETLKPAEVFRFTANTTQLVGLELLKPIACKFSQKIAKKGGILSISEGGHYLIARRAAGCVAAEPWVFKHPSQLEELKQELQDEAVIGFRLNNDKMRVIFTKEDAAELEIIEDIDTGWNQLVTLWIMDTVRAYLHYDFQTPLPFDAFFDINAQVPVVGENGVEETESAVVYFYNVMSSLFMDLEVRIAEIVRADPYRLFTVETKPGGIFLYRHGDVRVMLFERDRENEELAKEEDD